MIRTVSTFFRAVPTRRLRESTLLLLASHLLILAYPQNSFTLTDGGWTYFEDIDQLGIGGFVDPNSTNHMSQNWWWFHTKDQPSELPLINLQSLTQPAPNQVSLSFVENSPSIGSYPSTFLFQLDYTLTASSPTSAKVTIQWTVTLQSGYPEEFGFFPYFNFDLNNTPFDDTAQLVSASNPYQIQFGDGAATAIIRGSVTAYSGPSFGFRWQIDRNPALLNTLLDSSFNHLSNSTSPLTGDVEGAFEFLFSMSNPGATVSGTLEKLLIVPEPASVWVLGAGLIGVLYRRKRRRRG